MIYQNIMLELVDSAFFWLLREHMGMSRARRPCEI